MSQHPFRPLAVSRTAAITAVGGSAEQTASSIRAGISRRREHPTYQSLRADEYEEPGPLVVCSVDTVDPALAGVDRLLALLIPAVTELCEGAELGRRDVGGTALLLALPALDDAVASWRLGETLAPAFERRSGLSFKTVRQTSSGHPGMIELLGEAHQLLASGEVEACVVAGVDSYLSSDRLHLLDAAYRLKSRRNVDGFCPGEAASALLVEGPRRLRARGVTPEATVSAVGLGREPETLRASDKASTGAGLTEALRAALAPAGPAPWALCDLNGESYRAFEWGVTLARLGSRLERLPRLVHPASSLGDVGAATGGVLLAVAAAAMRRGWAPSREALLWTASEGALRAAARIAPGEDSVR